MSRIGFEVPEWKSKPMTEYTNEELLEYWFILRRPMASGEVSHMQTNGVIAYYVVDLQNEILRRMNKQVKEN